MKLPEREQIFSTVNTFKCSKSYKISLFFYFFNNLKKKEVQNITILIYAIIMPIMFLHAFLIHLSINAKVLLLLCIDR